MKDSSVITFNDKKITVEELTVKQVRETLSSIDKADPQLIDELMDCPVPALVITEATGITYAEMEECKPSELKQLVDEVVSVNPSFASMIKRRVEAYEKMMAKISGSNLTAQSA